MSMGRLLLFVGGPMLFFMPAAFAVAIAVYLDYLKGGTQPASEEFFWIAAATIPIALFLATWLLPRRLPTAWRTIRIDTSGYVTPMAFYDDLRLAMAWFFCVVLALAALGGFIGSALSLNDCARAFGTCGTVATHRLAIYGLVAAIGDLVALAGVRLQARLLAKPRLEEQPEASS